MVAINFKKQFAPDVESGIKKQTIRAKARCKPGDVLQLYTGQRTKQCRKLKEVECKNVVRIIIAENAVILAKKLIIDSEKGLKAIANDDGFKSWDDMKNFFSETHGLPFLGHLIKWD